MEPNKTTDSEYKEVCMEVVMLGVMFQCTAGLSWERAKEKRMKSLLEGAEAVLDKAILYQQAIVLFFYHTGLQKEEF